jgi:putative ABC transport system substrate-binding protein
MRLNRREVLFAVSAWVTAPAWGAAQRRYTLLYPELPDPERGVFRVIREGFASTVSRAGGVLTEHPIATTASADTVSSTIASDRPDVLITLGRTATLLAQQAKPSMPWLTGATELPVPTPGVGGVSLVVNPDRFLATLSEVAPRINRVAVVMDPQRFGWLRAPMEHAARARSKQVIVYEASTVAQAATHYLNILRYGNPMTDSLWLLEQGQFVNVDTLPRIIEEAWANELLVFSSVLQHVSEGSLFALYMDPRTLGGRLGQLAVSTDPHAATIAFDDAPARALNLRTARHLSKIVDVATTKSFDLTLGER